MTLGSRTTVWIAPSATSFSCLCEACLERGRRAGALFTDAIAAASVRGSIAREVESLVVECPSGHRLELRRVERPPGLDRPDDRQLQILSSDVKAVT